MGSLGGVFNTERSLQRVKTNACQSQIKLPISAELQKDSGLKRVLSVLDTSHYENCLWVRGAAVCGSVSTSLPDAGLRK